MSRQSTRSIMTSPAWSSQTFAAGDDATVESINNLKEDPMFNQLPILAVIGDRPPVTQWEACLSRIISRKGDLERTSSPRYPGSQPFRAVVEINPLTRFSGQHLHQPADRGSSLPARGLCPCLWRSGLFQTLQRPYGFSRGDEVIKITGRSHSSASSRASKPQGASSATSAR